MLTSTSSLGTNEHRIPEVCAGITLLLLRLRMRPSKQSISQTSTWRPWLKTTCSEALGKTDCTACRWPPERSLLMFLIAGVTEIKFAPLPPTHTQPFVLVGLVKGVYECALEEPDTARLQRQKGWVWQALPLWQDRPFLSLITFRPDTAKMVIFGEKRTKASQR